MPGASYNDDVQAGYHGSTGGGGGGFNPSHNPELGGSEDRKNWQKAIDVAMQNKAGRDLINSLFKTGPVTKAIRALGGGGWLSTREANRIADDIRAGMGRGRQDSNIPPGASQRRLTPAQQRAIAKRARQRMIKQGAPLRKLVGQYQRADKDGKRTIQRAILGGHTNDKNVPAWQRQLMNQVALRARRRERIAQQQKQAAGHGPPTRNKAAARKAPVVRHAPPARQKAAARKAPVRRAPPRRGRR